MLRRTFPFASGSGGGALAVRVAFTPLEKYSQTSPASVQQVATIEGGTPPYIASWTRVGGSSGISVSGGLDYATFTASEDPSRPVSGKSGLFQVEITDSAYSTASTTFMVNFFFGLEEP